MLSRLLRRRAAFERTMDDEMRFHLEMEARELERQGMSPEEARRAARVAFGGVERFKEDGRDARGGRVLDELRRDAVYAVRAARRAPVFTLVAVLTLALGIGATTAIFSVVRGVLLRELPFAEPERLVRVWSAAPTRNETRSPLSIPDFEDWRRQGTAPGAAFERMAAFSTLPSGLVLTEGEGEPVRLRTAFVSEDFFTTLGVRPLVGRLTEPSEYQDGRNRVVVLSEGLWRSRFGADPGIAGRAVRFNDEPFVVVGVVPAAVRFPASPEVWTPLTVVPASGIPRGRFVRWPHVVGRLRPGVTPERARAELSAVARRLEAEYGASNAGWTGATVVGLHEDVVGDVRGRLLVIFGAVVLVLALACANVANLVLARATMRGREMAVRTALGAGRGRLVRQLLTESVLLALAGGALGVALAWWGAGALAAVAPRWLPPVSDVRPDWMVLGFALAVSALTGIAFGLIPATRPQEGIAAVLRDGGRGIVSGGGALINQGPTLRQMLVAAEVGLAVMLVAGAGLLVKSFARLSQVELGFDSRQTIHARMTIPNSRYASSTTYLPAAQRMLASVRAVPGVEAAAIIKDAPLRGNLGETSNFDIPARPAQAGDQRPVAAFFPVTPGYLQTMRIPLQGGRDLTEQDGDTLAGAVVVSAAAARAYWPGRSPLGEEIALGPRRLRVVGVAGDARYAKVDSAAGPVVYIPQPLMTRRIVTIVARAREGTPPASLVPAVRAAIRAAEPAQPITEIGTMRDAVGDAVAAPRFLAALVALFGVLALVLATVGIYGVVAYIVGQRTQEIGVRMALGARPRDIVAWTLRTGLAPVLAGLAAGVAAALALSRLIAAQLYAVSPTDPVVFAAVVAVLAAVSLLASAVPATRAARVEPTVALRE